MPETIFTKIINREIPADIIYEDENSLAFLDINPVSKGHILLISKNPYPWITDVPEDELAELFIKAQKLIIKMKKALNCDFVQISVVGKDVPHFHIHLIPRYFDDTLPMSPTTNYDSLAEKASYAEKIKNTE